MTGPAKRIIAKLLIEDGVLVKYRRFTEGRRVVGDPVSTAMVLADQRVDEFIVCDLGEIQPDLVRAMVINTMTPVTAAGGIHTMGHVDALIRESGADKVVIKDFALIEEVSKKYGSQAIVFPVDYNTIIPAMSFPACIGELLFTDIYRDGTRAGLSLYAASYGNGLPVVLCGGCGSLGHAKEAFAAGADGVAISSMFAFTDKSPIKLRSYLISEGINVRRC